MLVTMNDPSALMSVRRIKAEQVVQRYPGTEYAKQAAAFLADPENSDAAKEAQRNAALRQSRAVSKKDLAACESKVKQAPGLGLITDIKINSGFPRVYVGRTFHNITIDAKAGLFESIQCVMFKGDGSAIPMTIYDGMTGKKIGRWDGYRVRLD
ncbi:hypothetical protein [Aquilutibacter rugosus]|uniref:hypothetical protein n=1 Tax=Aquilutibacter rugosus TaxID=3115820 RepID=UPI002F41ACA3